MSSASSSATDSGESSGGGGVGSRKKKPLEPIVTVIDLLDAKRLEERGRECEPLIAGLNIQQRILYETLGFGIFIGEEWRDPADILRRDSTPGGGKKKKKKKKKTKRKKGDEEDASDEDDGDDEDDPLNVDFSSASVTSSTTFRYTNTKAFRRAIAQFDYDRRFYEQLFPIAILRKRKDMIRYSEDVLVNQQATSAGMQETGDDGLTLAGRWEPFDPDKGTLVWVEDPNTGLEYYRYSPHDERLLDVWDYVIYRQPHHHGPYRPQFAPYDTQQIVRPLSAYVPGVEAGGIALVPPEQEHVSASSSGSASSSTATARLPCRFRDMFREEDGVGEARIQLNVANHSAANQPFHLIMRPAREMLPDAMAEALRLTSEDMNESELRARYESMAQGAAYFMELLREMQSKQLQLEGYNPPGSMPSKSTRTALRYDRQLPGQRAIHWAEGVASVERDAPQTLRDPISEWIIYVGEVARRMGSGLTATDLLDETLLAYAAGSKRVSSGATPLPMSSVASLRTTSGAVSGSVAAEAEARVLAQDKRIEDLLPAMRGAQDGLVFLYSQTFAWLDLVSFSNLLEEYGETERERVFEILTRGGGGASDDMGGSRRRRQRAIGAALGKGEKLSVSDMRHVLTEQLLNKDYTPISIRFDLGQRRRKSEMLMRPHDALDPAIMDRNLKIVMAVNTSCTDGNLDPRSLVDVYDELLGIETKPLSKAQATAMMPQPAPPAPSSSSGGGGKAGGGAAAAAPKPPPPAAPPSIPVAAVAKRARGDDDTDGGGGGSRPKKKPRRKE